MNNNIIFTTVAPFEAARKVQILPKGHRSSVVHGHSFEARIRAIIPSEYVSFPGSEVDDLQKILKENISVLDYKYLNEIIDIPTNENIARWLRSKLNFIGLQMVGIKSTADQGVDLDKNDNAHIWHKFRFEAAHKLPNVPEGHQCGRMHGHGFEVILHANQDLKNDEIGVDFDDIVSLWKPLKKVLNYSCLNDLPGLENPTSEMLAAWLWSRLKPKLEALSWITVYETVTAGCHYDGENYRIWKEFKFESALTLKHAPKNDPRINLHGHSYISRLHLTAPLDKVMGWTVDYGDVKELFKPAYKEIDHHLLDDLTDLTSTDLSSLLIWLKNKMYIEMPRLDRIDLYQTPGCGAILSWGNNGPVLPN